jgi:two-component SAPR family response regulator
MPAMNGYEFVTKVKQINRDVKVCLMSAFEINDLELGLPKSVRIDEFLQKPLSLEKLTKIIGGMLTMYNK